MNHYRTFDEVMVEDLKDHDEARAFLELVIQEYEEDSDTEAFMLAVRLIAEAQGGIGRLAEKSHLNRQNLYKILTGKTTPRFDTTLAIMKGLGFRFSVKNLPSPPYKQEGGYSSSAPTAY